MELIDLVRDRGAVEGWNYGIYTADRYVKTLEMCAGHDACDKFMCRGKDSYADAVKRAANTLSYSNSEMILQDSYGSGSITDDSGNTIEIPKNTLMVFKHVLTSSRKDRDGDILRTQGARPDPNMLLLWQHAHTLPIGKVLGIAERTPNRLSMYTAIVDVNDVAADAALMVENKMGRFSHGFKTLAFTTIKDSKAGQPDNSGFDVSEFEILEASLVSVPANVDAVVEDVIMSLDSRGKFTSSIMKSVSSGIRSTRTKSHSIPVTIDLGVIVSEKRNESSSPDKTERNRDEAKGSKRARQERQAKADKECGCGKSVKVGRTVSAKNREVLRTIQDHITTLHDTEHLMTKGGKALCRECVTMVKNILDSDGVDLSEQRSTSADTSSSAISVKEAMAAFLSDAGPNDMDLMMGAIKAINRITSRA